MAKAYQFSLPARKETKGAIRFSAADELLCNTVYLSKGAVNLMGEVFPNGMPNRVKVTIEPDYEGSPDWQD